MHRPLVIRPAVATDDLAGLWRDVYARQHAPLLPAGTSIPFTPAGRAYVGEWDGRLAGFCSLDQACLSELWVGVDWQRRGVGTALIRFAEASIRDGGADEATLTVLAINRPAILFYEHAGWTRDPQALPSVTGMAFLRYRKRL